ncbi:MAG: type III-A CRISPR-associated RAMP protein Csm5 [Melioribacteraceae bacterium]|nr:MAG: type III-A CRISPR-associated RAMP protein Csm5 [Melioribacteraceae bacterium]
MKLKIHTISPVHIGSGNALQPFEYIIEDGIYYRLNQNKAFELAYARYPDFADRLSTWIEKTTRNLESTRDNHRRAQIRERFNFKYFCESVLQDSELADEITNSAYLYKCEVPYDLEGKKEIHEQLKTADGSIYIPGSSIKGAIRTVLAWRAFSHLTEKEQVEILDNVIGSHDFKNGRGKFIDKELNEKLFVCGVLKRIKGNNIKDFSDIKFDIMKFIRISDAKLIDGALEVCPSNLYLTDKSPQPQAPALECIRFNSSFEFDISINEDEIRKIYEVSLSTKDKWIEFDRKFKNLFDFYPHEAKPGELEVKIVQSIKLAIADANDILLKSEEKWLNNIKDQVIEQGTKHSNANFDEIRGFYESYDQIPQMFKIGWGSGFVATTMFSMLMRNEATQKRLEKIFDKFKIGVPPQKKRDPNVKPVALSKFPKSRRLIAEELNEPIDPMGWVALLDFDQNLELE